MHFALNRWQIRNEAYHDKQTRDKYESEQKLMTEEIRQRFEKPAPSHPAIDRLMHVKEDELTSGPNGPMRAWLDTYELVMKYLAPSLITTFLT